MRKISEVLRLRFEKGLAFHQVASACGVSSSTAIDYVSRAKAAGLSWPLPADLDERGLSERLFSGRRRPPSIPSAQALPEYTGQLHLLKGWCGRRHGVAKVLHLDTIHSERGRPCFVQHYSAYDDLRERFFMTMALFNGLFPPERRRGRLSVLDRGIYGLETFRRWLARGGAHRGLQPASHP